MDDFIKSTLEESQEIHSEKEQEILEDPETKIGEGRRKHVHQTHLGYIIKVFKTEHGKEFLQNIHELTHNNSHFPWSDIDQVQNYGESEFIIRQEPINITHQNAIEDEGIQQIIEKDVEMIMELHKDGIKYKDFKPANIAYQKTAGRLEPKAIDIYDPYALEEGQFKPEELRSVVEKYIHGGYQHEGLQGEYEFDALQAERTAASTIIKNHPALKHLEDTGNYTVMTATREIRE